MSVLSSKSKTVFIIGDRNQTHDSALRDFSENSVNLLVMLAS